MKKISVIVPVYNCEKYLNKCIESIINQTYKNSEIILVDDGSTDNSGNICDSYKDRDSRIIVIHKNNTGVSSARNEGLKVASGDLISFIDSDDYIDVGMFEHMMSVYNEQKCDIVICNFDHGNNEVIKRDNLITFSNKEYPQISYYNKGISGFVCNKLYDKKVIFYQNNKHITFDENITIGEDDLFNYEILNKNEELKYCYDNKVLYHYIINEGGAVNQKFNEKKLSYFSVKEREIEILKKHNMTADFLKADYIINAVRTKIIMDKLKIRNNKNFNYIIEKKKSYIKQVNIKKIKKSLLLKLSVAVCFPFLYKLLILYKNKYN